MSGAVILTEEIDGQPYRLTFKFGTMVLAEREFGEPITPKLELGEDSLQLVSCLFWAVLQPAHRMTRDGSDNLVDEAGVGQVMEWLGKGLREYFNVPDPEKDGDAPGEPQSTKGSGKT